MMRIEVENLTCGYALHDVIRGFSAVMEKGQVFCLLGQNGIGKTTLFKTILGFLPVKKGRILFNGRDAKTFSRQEYAKVLGYVPQARSISFGFSVLDVLLMGRIMHMRAFSSPKRTDLAVVHETLERLGIISLRDRTYTELSGGEQQMVLIARALAQEPAYLMMDEPTSNLDFGNQVRVMQTIRDLAGQGYGVVMTTHFPDHAFLCGATVALMQKKHVYHIHTDSEQLTEDDLFRTYGVSCALLDVNHKGTRLKICRPMLGVATRKTASA